MIFLSDLTLVWINMICRQGVPRQSLLEQCQMLFQPSDLLPLDSGYFPVSVHIPVRHKQHNFQSNAICYLNRVQQII